ncbi:transposase [Zoogloea sp.]|uniref:transposase n=1 Tax=Zoogloea sp. TaxID=49181 RepID=UPI0014167347|nr:MAG: IS110 family transposase [Zoogloea sp.]
MSRHRCALDCWPAKEGVKSVPGLGERTASTLLAFLAEPRCFDNARQAVAFAGLDPRQHESGMPFRPALHGA